MSNKNRTAPSDLVCLECGNINTIYRRLCNQRPISHIKDIWCFKCMKVTKHYEVHDIDKFMNKYTESTEKTKVKELVRNARRKY